jgi:hypothetical protein
VRSSMKVTASLDGRSVLGMELISDPAGNPTVTPDRKHILFTGGDRRTKTNHLFLLDITDLADTQLVN